MISDFGAHIFTSFSALRRLQKLHKKHNEAGPSEKLATDHDELSRND